MAELPEFNGDQILFLQTIFNVFHTKGKWPTYDDVDRIITQKHPNFNMEAVSKNLPDGFAAGFGFDRRYDQEAFFIVPALHYCQGAEEEIADFIRVVRLCVERYDRYYSFGEQTPEKDALEFSSELLSSQLHMELLAIRRMGLLLYHEYDIVFGFYSDIEYNSWHFPLKRGTDGVSRFRGVETFEQYIEKRSLLVPPYYTGRFPLGLAQDKPVSDLTVMGLRRASTQVHVHGDQYNISGNSGDVKIKSPSTETKATKDEYRSPWVSGSFYLTVLIVVIVALVVAARLLPIYVLPIVLVGGILAVSIIGALQLRQDDRLNEDNFLKLMALSLRYLPLIKGREAKSGRKSISASVNTSAPDDKTT